MDYLENLEKGSPSEQNANMYILWQLILGVMSWTPHVNFIGLLTILVCTGPEISLGAGLSVLK